MNEKPNNFVITLTTTDGKVLRQIRVHDGLFNSGNFIGSVDFSDEIFRSDVGEALLNAIIQENGLRVDAKAKGR